MGGGDLFYVSLKNFRFKSVRILICISFLTLASSASSDWQGVSIQVYGSTPTKYVLKIKVIVQFTVFKNKMFFLHK